IADLDALRRYRALRGRGALAEADLQNTLWQYQVRANGNHPIAPASLFGANAPRVPIFADALASPAHAAFVPAAAPAFSSEALVPSPLNAAEMASLSAGWSLDETVLRSIFLSQTLPTDALEGIGRALDLHASCQMLGVTGQSLPRFLVRDFSGL